MSTLNSISTETSDGHMARKKAMIAAPRALNTGLTFWVAMFAASVFGTNLGDVLVDTLDLGRVVTGAGLFFLCALAIGADRWRSGGQEIFYWVAVVMLRAAATDLADHMTHDLKISYIVATIALAILTLVVGLFTRPEFNGANSPLVDFRYWLAMLLAGVFGTIGGDLAAHTFGLFIASGALVAVLVFAFAIRAWRFSSVMLAYWCVVLIERVAGTPVGDAIASHKTFNLGTPTATMISGTVFLVMLVWRLSSVNSR